MKTIRLWHADGAYSTAPDELGKSVLAKNRRVWVFAPPGTPEGDVQQAVEVGISVGVNGMHAGTPMVALFHTDDLRWVQRVEIAGEVSVPPGCSPGDRCNHAARGRRALATLSGDALSSAIERWVVHVQRTFWLPRVNDALSALRASAEGSLTGSRKADGPVQDMLKAVTAAYDFAAGAVDMDPIEARRVGALVEARLRGCAEVVSVKGKPRAPYAEGGFSAAASVYALCSTFLARRSFVAAHGWFSGQHPVSALAFGLMRAIEVDSTSGSGNGLSSALHALDDALGEELMRGLRESCGYEEASGGD